MSEKNKTSRREFFARGAQTAAILGLGGVSARAATAPISRYREVGSFKTGAREVRGIAVGENNRIYIAADNGIQAFDETGSEIRRYSISVPPSSVAVRKGLLYVGAGNQVKVFHLTKDTEETWPSLGEGVHITSLAVTEKGEVFAGDGNGQLIWHFDREGHVLGKIDYEGKKFAVPQNFFPIAAAGDKLVVGHLGRHRIETFDSEGKLVGGWGEKSRHLEGFSGCCNPVSLAMIPRGGFVTAEGGLPRIKIFDAQGKFLELVAGPEELESNARGSHERSGELKADCQQGGLELAVDSSRRILALDRVTAEVRVFAHQATA